MLVGTSFAAFKAYLVTVDLGGNDQTIDFFLSHFSIYFYFS